MPLHIQNIGGKYCVVDPAGKKFGCHPSKKQAINQIAAIESSKKRREKSGLDLIAEDKIRNLAAELNQTEGEGQPPIVIVSDGTPEGTMLMLHGQFIEFSSLNIDCYRGDYPSCNLSITLKEIDQNGMEVRKTLTLRKEPQPQVEDD